jgi:hypothetical protein
MKSRHPNIGWPVKLTDALAVGSSAVLGHRFMSWLPKPGYMRAGDNLGGMKPIGKVCYVNPDAPKLGHDLYVLLRIVIAFTDFFRDVFYRCRIKRLAKYFDNLGIRFCGVILDVHSYRYFGEPMMWPNEKS